MNQRVEGRARLTVLGGFLGSGKTTWLRHQLHTGRFAESCVIVNEAAETPVDDALLGQASQLRVLAGGCACCAGRTALVALLRELVDVRSRTRSSSRRLQQIVLETSGLADPAAIVEVIRSDPVLVRHIVVNEIIVVVDALHALGQLQREPLGRKQIEIADQLIVTKVDTAEPASLRVLLATLASMNPGATLAAAVRGSAEPLADFQGTAPLPLCDLGTAPSRGPITPIRLCIDETADWPGFTVWLSALLHARGDDIVRVKGVVRTPAGRLLLQSVHRIVQSPEILPEGNGGPDLNAVVVLGRGYTPDQLRRSLRYFTGDSPSPRAGG
ncbi:MAG: GTP-binding protein [Gammaproteobacteria bacterium]|nr:GTP-binding protein [Gammaproteobacteria bacterium]